MTSLVKGTARLHVIADVKLKTSGDNQVMSSDIQTTSDDNQATTDDNQATNDDNQASTDDTQAISDDIQAISDDNQATTDDNQATSDENQAINDDNQATSNDNQVTTDDNQLTSDDNYEYFTKSTPILLAIPDDDVKQKGGAPPPEDETPDFREKTKQNANDSPIASAKPHQSHLRLFSIGESSTISDNSSPDDAFSCDDTAIQHQYCVDQDLANTAQNTDSTGQLCTEATLDQIKQTDIQAVEPVRAMCTVCDDYTSLVSDAAPDLTSCSCTTQAARTRQSALRFRGHPSKHNLWSAPLTHDVNRHDPTPESQKPTEIKVISWAPRETYEDSSTASESRDIKHVDPINELEKKVRKQTLNDEELSQNPSSPTPGRQSRALGWGYDATLTNVALPRSVSEYFSNSDALLALDGSFPGLADEFWDSADSELDYCEQIDDKTLPQAINTTTDNNQKPIKTMKHLWLQENHTEQSAEDVTSIRSVRFNTAPNRETTAVRQQTKVPATSISKLRHVTAASAMLMTKYRRRFDRRAMVTITLLILFFVVFKLPLASVMIVMAICRDCVGARLLEGVTWLFWAKSLINPFLYAFISKRFRWFSFNMLSKRCPCINSNRVRPLR